MSNHKLEHYIPWREKRINKVIQILGKDSLAGKSLLELGCGLGHIGAYFRDNYGTLTTFAEVRETLISASEHKLLKVDQDKDWNLGEKYDIIIHWGVLYHLENWQNDLRCVVEHMHENSVLFLESEVTDSDECFDIKINENREWDDQAFHGKGSRPSPSAIEQELIKLNLKFIRYDDVDLDTDNHKYSWEHKNTNKWKCGLRRFWVATT